MRFLPLLLCGCVSPGTGDARRSFDVRGSYAAVFDDALGLDLSLDGTMRHTTSTGSDLLDFGSYNGQPLQLDVAAFCGRAEIVCPNEALPTSIGVDEIDPETAATEHAITLSGRAGVVHHDQQDQFAVPLGTNSSCEAGSAATGRFSHRGETASDAGVAWPGDAPVDGIADGKIATSWLGSCAFSSLSADARLTLTLGFVATRVGNYRPVDLGASD